MTASLTDFLLVQIADRESVARDMQDQARAGRPFFDVARLAGGMGIHELIDPARVLAECEAKRRIIQIAVDQIRLGREARGWDNWEDMANQTLRVLALPYADHPDFREEWRA